MPKDETDPEDPFELQGVALPGDTLEPMAEAFIEEFLRMGWTDDQVLRLFERPFYGGPNLYFREVGRERVLGLIRSIRAVRRPLTAHG